MVSALKHDTDTGGTFGGLSQHVILRAEVTAHELDVAYGPEVEAWFLGTLRACGLLVDNDDINRLLDLESEGYGVECEDDSDTQSESLGCDEDSEVEGDDQYWDAEELSVDR